MKIKRIVSAILTFAVMLSTVSFSATAATGKVPTIKVESISGFANDSVNVVVSIADNPGILGASLRLTYDEHLTLTAASAFRVQPVLC